MPETSYQWVLVALVFQGLTFENVSFQPKFLFCKGQMPLIFLVQTHSPHLDLEFKYFYTLNPYQGGAWMSLREDRKISLLNLSLAQNQYGLFEFKLLAQEDLAFVGQDQQ